jgi:hypothetical protein
MQPVRVFALLVLATTVAVATPPSASGSGGPILPLAATGNEGVESADGQYRYVVLDGKGSIAAKIAEGTGEIDAAVPIRDPYDGLFGFPQVAADSSVSGLSADGGTLVLIRSAGPIDLGRLVVLGTGGLRIKNRIELKGQFSFDAISPDGRTAYVVEYPRPFRYDRYRVLKLNLRSGHLAKTPITDEDVGLDEDEEEQGVEGEMRGLALSRVESDDGRWAYTLYDGAGDIPFIHALDTVGDRAVCIFMPTLEALTRTEIAKATIEPGPEPGTISVLGRDHLERPELARVDTATFAVTTPQAEVSESGSILPESLLIVLALTAVGIGSIAILRRRRGEAGGEDA